MPAPDLAAQITVLKQQAATAQRLRAEATSALDFGRHQLTQIDAELTELGINPENAEQELLALEAQLAATVEQLHAALKAEIAELNRILDLGRQAQLVR